MVFSLMQKYQMGARMSQKDNQLSIVQTLLSFATTVEKTIDAMTTLQLTSSFYPMHIIVGNCASAK